MSRQKKQHNHSKAGIFRSIPLWFALTVPFILLTVTTVGIVGFLSFVSGRQAVNELALNTQEEILFRVESETSQFLKVPHYINNINSRLVSLDVLGIDEMHPWKNHLPGQLEAFDYPGNIALGNEAGKYIGVDFRNGDIVVLQMSGTETGFDLHTYSMDQRNIVELLDVSRDYDPRIRPWYSLPAKTREPVWSEVYKHFVDPTLQIALSTPILDNEGVLLGVATTAVRLNRISDYLKSLRISQNGQAFIMDSSGLFIASSVEEPFHILDDGSIERVNILQSIEPMVSHAATALSQALPDYSVLDGPENITFRIDGERYFLKASLLGMQPELDWVIVIIVPEKDFMGQIYANTKRTILLSLAALLGCIALGFILSRWVTRPIIELNQAARAVTAGNLDARVNISRNDELGELGQSFNLMSARLEESVQALEKQLQELKESQTQIRKSEDKFRTLFNSTSYALMIHDLHTGEIIDGNETALKLYGYSSVEDMSRNYVWSDPPYSLIEAKEYISRAYKQGPQHFEWQSVKKTGETFWEDVLLNVIKIDEKDCILSTTIDLTEKKNAQARQELLENQLRHAQKMEAIGTMAGGIAHDFNNILQVIGGYVQLLTSRKKESDSDYPALAKIQKSLERAAVLIRQLLMFSRKMDIRFRPLDLNKEVKDAQEILSQTLPRMISFRLNLDPELRAVSADHVQIQQVLFNLCSNAADAMPEGGEILIETSNIILEHENSLTLQDLRPGDYVLLSVSDTGVGMNSEVRKLIFDPFYTTKEVGKGTGLGLASVYGVVKGHGGYIYCYSEEGKGTCFKIYFPAVEPAASAGQKKDSPDTFQGQGETILIVDDEMEILELTAEALESFNYTPLKAENAEEALNMYKADPADIDLILLDLNMPGMGGKKCLEKLLEFDPDVKVVIASGYSAHGHSGDFLNQGAMGFMEKPYQINDLATLVRKVLDRSH